MTNQRTPGPWVIDDYRPEKRDYIVVRGALPDGAPEHMTYRPVVAHVFGQENAELIAAAGNKGDN